MEQTHFNNFTNLLMNIIVSSIQQDDLYKVAAYIHKDLLHIFDANKQRQMRLKEED